MEATTIVVMVKNMETQILETELCSISLSRHEQLLEKIFAVQTDAGYDIHMLVSTGSDMAGWQFEAVYDYYDMDIYEALDCRAAEAEDTYNPAWRLVFACPAGLDDLSDRAEALLDAHAAELMSVFEVISDKESLYQDE